MLFKEYECHFIVSKAEQSGRAKAAEDGCRHHHTASAAAAAAKQSDRYFGFLMLFHFSGRVVCAYVRAHIAMHTPKLVAFFGRGIFQVVVVYKLN